MPLISPTRESKKRSWIIITLVAFAFLTAAGIYFVFVPVQKSKQFEQALIEQFDWTYKYTPPADGFLEPGRLEKFIHVREAVQPNCKTFQGILDSVIRLEEIESDPDMAASDKAAEGFSGLKKMLSGATGFLEFMDARNQALLAEEMGLGEYYYIYFAAYGSQLAAESTGKYAEQDDAGISSRTRSEFTRILMNQLAALETGGSAASTDLATRLQSEITNLKRNPESSPWAHGPPPGTLKSLAPYSEQIDALYCEGIVKIELLQKNRGLNFGG